MLSNAFHQIAWVVADLDRAEAAWRDVVGTGSFFRMTGLAAAELGGTYRGDPATWSCDVALGYHGDLMVELIRPIDGPSVWQDFIDAGGTGPHHLGYLVADLDAASADLAARGFADVMTVETGGIRAVYHDTTAAMGIYTELIELDADGQRFFDSLRDAG